MCDFARISRHNLEFRACLTYYLPDYPKVHDIYNELIA